MDRWLLDAYTKADKVSCGVYVADFNEKHRKPKVSLAKTSSLTIDTDW